MKKPGHQNEAERVRKRALDSIRGAAMELGYSIVACMSDAEIEKSVLQMAENAAMIGVTVEEAREAMQVFMDTKKMKTMKKRKSNSEFVEDAEHPAVEDGETGGG